MKKNILYIIFSIIVIFIINFTYAKEDKTSFTSKVGFELYEYRVQTICDEYKYNKKDITNGKIPFVINIPDNYLELNKVNKYFLASIKNTHRTNMNNIYKCGILSTQKKSLTFIKEDLIKQTPSVGQKIGGKIDSQINKIELTIKALKCNIPRDNNSIQKLAILSQATYQTCKYINYLEYLKDYNSNIENLISYDSSKDKDKNKETQIKEKNELNEKLSKSYDISNLINKKTSEINKINKEINHTYKVFPLAFQAYTEYENNITIHFLLNLIKVDYITFREKLHKSLNPINQVVYKISNAMKK